MKNATIFIVIAIISILLFIGAIDLLGDLLHFIAEKLNTDTKSITIVVLLITTVVFGSIVLKNVIKQRRK